MNHPTPTSRLSGAAVAALVLDAGGVVRACTPAAEDMLGLPPRELCGRPVGDLLADGSSGDGGIWPALAAGPGPYGHRAVLRRPGGSPAHVHCDLLPLSEGDAAQYLLHVAPVYPDEQWRWDEASGTAVADETSGAAEAPLPGPFSRSRTGPAVRGPELRVVRLDADGRPGPVDGGGPGIPSGALELDRLLVAEDAAAIEQTLRRTAETGETLVDEPHRARHRSRPGADRYISLSALPLAGADGRRRGVAAAFTDITEQYRARQRRELVNAAAKRIGTSLDTVRCAEEVADLLVPDFADLAAVDLTEVVLVGEEPGDFRRGAPLRRVAAAASDGAWPDELYPTGATVRVRRMETGYLREGAAFLASDMTGMRAAFSDDPQRSRLLLPENAASFMVVPLHARGLVLGSVMLWRTAGRHPFDRQDAETAEEVISRAALVVDNARRYTRERRTAEALRRSLLPPAAVESSAAEAAGTCVPAETTSGVGGTWFDVIPLSSARIAFAVGDAVGHGLEAIAATGRLRTAVQTLSDLDLAPEELLTHLDDLVTRLAADEESSAAGADGHDGGRPAGAVRGSTCLYAVYDPSTGQCTAASAGHPPPVVVSPDGAAHFLECRTGPSLGTGGLPFEPVTVDVAPDSLFAFYSGNLLAADPADAAADGGRPGCGPSPSARRLRAHLRAAARRHRLPAEVSRDALARLVPEPPDVDVTLLAARVRSLPEENVARWEFPADPAEVARARELAVGRLAAWGLEELAFTTELIVSELVTNAVRHAGAPVVLRLIKDRSLVCEVSDPSQTQPHLRRARLTDEGGRGLFLVAQLTHRWGSRYTPSGKTIWTEQPLPAGAPRGA